MPKRFTRTEQWDENWFMSMSPLHKAFWRYLNDKCDCAGIWQVNQDLADMQVKGKIDWETILEPFGKRVEVLSDEEWFLPLFVHEQYGKLSPECRPHAPVFKRLREAGLLKRVLKGFPKPIERLKEKEQYKEQVQDKEKEEGKGKGKGKALPVESPEWAKEIRVIWNDWRKAHGGGSCPSAAPSGAGMRSLVALHKKDGIAPAVLKRAAERYLSTQDSTEFFYAFGNMWGEKKYFLAFVDDDWAAPAKKGAPRDLSKPPPKPKRTEPSMPTDLTPCDMEWAEVLDALRVDTDKDNFDTWIATIKCLGKSGRQLHLACPSGFNRSRIFSNYGGGIVWVARENGLDIDEEDGLVIHIAPVDGEDER